MKKYRLILLLLLTGSIIILWRTLMPVKIIGVHKLGRTSAVVIVKNFPLTRNGSLVWWKQHKNQIEEKWNFLKSPKIHRIFFFQTDYKKNHGTDEDSDLLCFNDMNSEQNCIPKEHRPLVVRYYPDGSVEYETQYFFDPFLRRL